jgi:hypothetical protein
MAKADEFSACRTFFITQGIRSGGMQIDIFARCGQITDGARFSIDLYSQRPIELLNGLLGSGAVSSGKCALLLNFLDRSLPDAAMS